MPENARVRAVITGLVLVLFVAVFSLSYTVKPGDTLNKIAQAHDVTLAELVAANNISNPNLIFPGQVLVIPKTEAEIIHTVIAGDTLAKIAALYGTSISALIAANDIVNANLIRVGQQLKIPSSGGVINYDPNVRSGRSHIVKSNDTLSTIASQYSGVSASQIARANGILTSIIYGGTRLFLDGPDYTGKGSDTRIDYTVKSGDRLGDIAHAHGVTTTVIIRANNLANPNLLIPGQVLVIPLGEQWMCPVRNSSYFNDWGFPRSAGRYHEGNDLFAPRGTPVYAPVSGNAIRRTGSLGGNQVNLSGEDGVLYVHSHLDSYGKTGPVRAGEIIGYVGNTGNAAGSSPHLHFEMHLNGVVVNPYPSLKANGC